MKNSFTCLIISLLFISSSFFSIAFGQKEFGFKMPKHTNEIQFSFEKHNNLIIIPLTINRFFTLKFILDTGVENAILTEKLYADILDINYIRKIKIEGPGIIDSLEAYVANEITFGLPGGIIGENMNLIVLKEDYLQLSENTGDNIYGIIGYDIFSKFVVDVDYDNLIITLIDPKKFKKKRWTLGIPLDIRSTKPFTNIMIQQAGKKAYLDILVDTGASHALLIDYNHLDDFDRPKKTIITKLGQGIKGEIPGYMGRIDFVQIKKFDFSDVLVSAPFEGVYSKLIKRGARIGTIGGELLSRFHVTFDYSRGMMYLKKGSRYKQKFEYDMSGMSVNATGESLDTLKVVNVNEGSPAFFANIRKNDIIHSINGMSLRTNRLSDIYELLQSKDGRKIKCKLYQGDGKRKIIFRLKKII